MRISGRTFATFILVVTFALAAFCQAHTPNRTPTTYQNYVWGASVEDVIAAGLLPSAVQCERDIPNTFTCDDLRDALRDIRAGIAKEIMESGSQGVSLLLCFEKRRLLRISVVLSADHTFAEQIALLTKKFGAPSTRGTTVQQNAGGALRPNAVVGRWECAVAKWNRFDGATIFVDEEITIDSDGYTKRTVAVTFTSKELVDKEKADAAAKQPKY